jgi:phosphoglucosamine mutase
VERAPKTRIFGTDGIRGRAGEGWLTADRLSVLGRTLGEVIQSGIDVIQSGMDVIQSGVDVIQSGAKPSGGNSGSCLIGNDGRASSSEFEAALGRGLASAGLKVKTVGLITTPGLALLTRLAGFDCGVMLSASHNPAQDNGIKVFNSQGEKLSTEAEIEIESHLAANPEPVTRGPLPEHDGDLERIYLEHLTDRACPGLQLDGLELVVDCANGGGSRIAPRVFDQLGARVRAIAAEPDGDNINLDCGSTHPERLQAQVVSQGARLGIALDGDGDRCILVDERGQLVHGDGILTLLARHAAEEGPLADPRLVATVMSNRGLHRALREVGVSVLTVDVGDKHVVDALRTENLWLGGEQSGHVVFGGDNYYIGDGIYTALRVLRVLRETGRSLSELAAPYSPFPQVLLNVPVTRKPHLRELPAVLQRVREIESELGEDGRVLLRYSGTEPLARVMVEGPDAEMIADRARSVADLLAAALGQQPAGR